MLFQSGSTLLQYHIQTHQHDTTTTYITWTPVQPVLALFSNAKQQIKEQWVQILGRLRYVPAGNTKFTLLKLQNQ